MPRGLPGSAFQEGWLRCRAGDHGEGVAQMHEGLGPLREQGQSLFMPLYGVLLAETEAEAGHHDTALATIDAELASDDIRPGSRWFLAEAHRVRGELLLKSNPGDAEAAEAAFTQAIAVARGQSAKRFEFRAAMRLAQLWASQGGSTDHQGLLAILADGLADGSEFDGFPEMDSYRTARPLAE